MNNEIKKTLQATNNALDVVLIKHRAFRKTTVHLDECLNSYKGYGEPICILIHGHTGVGKTTLARSYLAGHLPSYEEDRKIVPVLNAVIPMPATMKNMASELLDKLGDPYSDRGTLEQRTKRLRKLLKECRTKLIVLDEFQHFIDRKSDRVILDVSDWLKNLISNTSIPVVLIGLPNSRTVLYANEQLMRRFSYQIELEPFLWTEKASRLEFTKILHVIDQELARVFDGTSGFREEARRFYAATKGLISLIMKVIHGGAYEAVLAGSNRIDLMHLAKAYRDRIQLKPSDPNPFLPDWDGQYADPLPETRHLNGNVANARIALAATDRNFNHALIAC